MFYLFYLNKKNVVLTFSDQNSINIIIIILLTIDSFDIFPRL